MLTEIEQALSAFEAEKAKLLGGDGKPIFAPEEHTSRLGALQADLQAALDKARGDVGGYIATARAKITSLEGQNPLDSLATGELETANARRAFFKEDVAVATVEDLTNRLKVAVAGSDRTNLFLFVRYLPARLELENSEPVNETKRRELFALQQLLRQAQERLNPSQAEEIKKLAGEIEYWNKELAESALAVQDATRSRRPVIGF